MKLMKVIKLGLILCSLTAILFGCSSNEETNKTISNEDLFNDSKAMDAGKMLNATKTFGDEEKLNIDFSTKPKNLKLNQSSALAVKVATKGEAVTDAEVVFEIWREGENQPIEVNTKPDNKGTYTLEGKFSQIGTYNLIAHVSALNRHDMQTFQFTIE